MNKVFSLVLQEERQRGLSISGTSLNMNNTALLAKTAPTPAPQNRFKNHPKSKDRPVCSHCGITGHTMEKCYRLHGFPPGYKFTKGKNSVSAANQVSSVVDHSVMPQLPITYEQCQQLMNFFKNNNLEGCSQTPAVNQVSSSPHEQLISHMTGTVSFDHKFSVFASSFSVFQKSSLTNSIHAPWIIDTGATDHMICTISLFTTITAVVSQ
jgi:hypothetical protein